MKAGLLTRSRRLTFSKERPDMTIDDPSETDIPLDASSAFTLPGFFQALKNEVLFAAVCTECDRRLIPPRPACYACGSRSLSLEEQSHLGTIVSFTAVYRPPSGFESFAPYSIGIVELASGARLLGRVIAPVDELSIGQSVTLRVRDPDSSIGTTLSYEKEWPIHEFIPKS